MTEEANRTSYYVDALSEGIIRPKENVGAFRRRSIDSLSGKILRLDPTTGDGVPSNPYYDLASPRAPRSRVWTLGLRNPFRMTLLPGTGSHDPAAGNPGILYIGNVGFDTWEELEVASGPRLNFGWPIYEGLDLHRRLPGVQPELTRMLRTRFSASADAHSNISDSAICSCRRRSRRPLGPTPVTPLSKCRRRSIVLYIRVP